jgi:hypothetical protein
LNEILDTKLLLRWFITWHLTFSRKNQTAKYSNKNDSSAGQSVTFMYHDGTSKELLIIYFLDEPQIRLPPGVKWNQAPDDVFEVFDKLN